MIVIPIASGLIALVTVVVLYRAKREATRPGLLPRVIALALIPPTFSVVAGVYRLRDFFNEMGAGADYSLLAIRQLCWEATRLSFLGVLAFLVVLITAALLLFPSLGEKSHETASEKAKLISGVRTLILIFLSLISPVLAAILLHYGNRVIVLVMSNLVLWEAENLPAVILQQIGEWAEIELYEIAPTIAAHVVGVVGWGSVLSLFLIGTAVVGGIPAGSRRFPASLARYALVLIFISCLAAGLHLTRLRSQMNWILEIEVTGFAENGSPPTEDLEFSGEPLLTHRVEPVYPELAKRARIQGVVILEVHIDEQGSVTDIELIRGHPLLNQAAIDAVRQWKYVPTLLGDELVSVIKPVTINFLLR